MRLVRKLLDEMQGVYVITHLIQCAVSNAYSLKMNSRPRTAAVSSEVLPQFPKTIVGELLWCHQDNLNTDGIYAGKWTYSEVPPEKQAEVAMENYDPKFKELARKGMLYINFM